MNSENLEELSEGHIKKPEEDLIFCDFKECVERGQYIKCYFDLCKGCPKYIEHKRRGEL